MLPVRYAHLTLGIGVQVDLRIGKSHKFKSARPLFLYYIVLFLHFTFIFHMKP